MLKNQNIICISSIDWDFVWQGHQEIMTTFARNGNRVLFIENTGVRSPRVKDVPRLLKRIRNWFKSTRGFRDEGKNLYVFSPIFFPFPYSRAAQFFNNILFVRTLKRWLKVNWFSDPILWTFLPTRTALNLTEQINNKLIVYYCIADFNELVRKKKTLKSVEKRILKKCDVVFAQGEKIKKKCSEYNKNVSIFPFGVNIDNFVNKDFDHSEIPKEILFIPKPLIGYIGGIHQHIDFKLLKDLINRNQKWSFVFVGPIQTNIKALEIYKNAFFLGQKEFSELPKYLSQFDVCLIPYNVSQYTDTVYPTKLNEYFAMGKPVISTPLPEVVEFNKRNNHAVFLASTVEEHEAEINKVLREEREEKKKERIEIAKNHSWSKTIEKMSHILEEAFDKKKGKTINWQKQFQRLYVKTRRKIVGLITFFVLIWALIFHTPFIWWLAKPLLVLDLPKKADAIVVLAGGVGESGNAGQGYEERVEYAVELYKKGFADYMIFSSGYLYKFKEAQMMKLLAISLGVQQQNISLEEKASSTYQNVKYTKEILYKKGWNEILLVSSPFHMRRVSLIFKNIAENIDVSYTPIPYSLYYDWPRDLHLISLHKQITTNQLRGLIHEYLGIVYYWWKGWI